MEFYMLLNKELSCTQECILLFVRNLPLINLELI